MNTHLLAALALLTVPLAGCVQASDAGETRTGDIPNPSEPAAERSTLNVAQHHWDREDWITTWGLVENPTETWVEASSVTITYLSADGQEVHTTEERTFRTMLAPGQATPFEDRYPDSDVQVRDIEVTAHAEPRDGPPSWHGSLKTEDVQQEINSRGNYDVQGNLTNTGDAELAGATVHIALFDQDGDVLNVHCDARHVPTDLEPGESGEFRFVMSPNGDVAEHRLYTDAAGVYS